MTLRFILDRLRKIRQSRAARDSAPPEDQPGEVDPFNPFPDPVRIEMSDVIDLHSIPPRQVPAVVEEFLEHARSRGYTWIRIIHGKGIGVQREIVRSILSQAPDVVEFSDAPTEAGGWGATIATLAGDHPARS